MDPQTKKTVLRMIPYGLYVLTARHEENYAAATINWVTQTAFEPPLIVIGVKGDSSAHNLIKDTEVFALNILGKDNASLAGAFFKPTEREGNLLNGQQFHAGKTGAPLLEASIASVECRLVDTIEKGDHSVFMGEVVEASLNKLIEGRADDHTLTLRDLGEKVFYGG